MRDFTPEELAPISPDVSNRDKKIIVRLDQQLVTAYEFNVPVFQRSRFHGRQAAQRNLHHPKKATSPQITSARPATWQPVTSPPAALTCPVCLGCNTSPKAASRSHGHFLAQRLWSSALAWLHQLDLRRREVALTFGRPPTVPLDKEFADLRRRRHKSRDHRIVPKEPFLSPSQPLYLQLNETIPPNHLAATL